MGAKTFSQEELNRIVALRLRRERERMSKEFENRMRQCMSSIHLLLYQEMCALKREIAIDSQEMPIADSTGTAENPAK